MIKILTNDWTLDDLLRHVQSVKFLDDALSPRQIECSIDHGDSEYPLSLDGDPDKRLGTSHRFRSMVVSKIHTDVLLTFVVLHFATFANPKELRYLQSVLCSVYMLEDLLIKVKEYYILKPGNLTGAQAPPS